MAIQSTVSLQKKSLDSADEQRNTSGKGIVDIVTIGDVKLSRATFQPGWRWSEHVKPIAKTESCQTLHKGYLVSGRLAVRAADGNEEELRPGDGYVIQPGHDAWVVGDEPVVFVDFSEQMEQYAKPA